MGAPSDAKSSAKSEAVRGMRLASVTCVSQDEIRIAVHRLLDHTPPHIFENTLTWCLDAAIQRGLPSHVDLLLRAGAGGPRLMACAGCQGGEGPLLALACRCLNEPAPPPSFFVDGAPPSDDGRPGAGDPESIKLQRMLVIELLLQSIGNNGLPGHPPGHLLREHFGHAVHALEGVPGGLAALDSCTAAWLHKYKRCFACLFFFPEVSRDQPGRCKCNGSCHGSHVALRLTGGPKLDFNYF